MRSYTAKMHRARDANLLYVSIWLLLQLKGSSVWTPTAILVNSHSGVERWKCRIVAASLALPFSATEQSNHYFSLVDGLSPSSWKIAVHRLMKRESQSEPTFWPKTGGALVKLRRRRRAVLTFSAAAAPRLYSGGGVAARPAWGARFISSCTHHLMTVPGLTLTISDFHIQTILMKFIRHTGRTQLRIV